MADGDPREGIFRQAVLDRRARRTEGRVLGWSGAPLWAFTAGAAAILAGVVLFLSLASFPRTQAVSGWVVPSSGIIRIVSRSDGIVESLGAAEGGEISRGAMIARIRLAGQVRSGDAEQTFRRAFDQQEKAVEAFADATRGRLRRSGEQLVVERAGVLDALKVAQARVRLLDERVKLAQNAVVRAETLRAAGYLSDAAVDQARNGKLELEDQRTEALADAVNFERQAALLAEKVAAVPTDIAVADAEAAKAYSELLERRTEMETRTTEVLVAPTDGVIIAMPLSAGQGIKAGTAVAVMTPARVQMIAELYVPSTAIASLRPGQEVRLTYQAFPNQKFGFATAMITSISGSLIAPEDVPFEGAKASEPMYRIRARLKKQTVSAYGREVQIQAGMLVSAHVIIERRNFFQWVLEPLYAVGRRG